MRLVKIIIVVVVCLGGALPIASGAPARFWISESATDPVPVAPTINAAIGQPRTLYIWAQPETQGGGTFRKLEAFTIDVVSLDASLQPESAPFIDFIDGTYKVENPTVTIAQKRFQYTTDSFRDAAQGGPLTSTYTAAQMEEYGYTVPDSIQGLQGVSPFALPSTAGIGHNSDPYRYGSGSGAAWRVGEFSFQALQSSGVNDLFLQIGWFGMRHDDDGDGAPPTPISEVVFGTNASPVYCNNTTSLSCHVQASPDWSHRQTSLPNETFDVRVNAVEFTPGDYNGDGEIGPEDYPKWQSSFGQTSATAGRGADGNGDGTINAADFVMWQKLASAGGSGASINDHVGASNQAVIAEPTTAAMATILLLLVLFETRRKVHHAAGANQQPLSIK